MKKHNSLIVALLIVLALSSMVNGEIILVENFDYTISSLLTANGWTAHSSAGSNPIDVTNGLSYSGYIGSGIGGAANVDNTGEDDSKIFSSISSGTLYFSFLVKVNTAVAGYFTHLGKSSSSFAARVFVQPSGANIVFGLSNTSTGAYGSTLFNTGTTYLCIVKYEVSTTGACSLWVVPSGTPANEVLAGTPEITSSGTGQDAIDRVCLRQYNASQNILVDGIRVATTWSEAVGSVEPTTQASSMNFTDVSETGLTINWTSGNGSNRIVVVKSGEAVSSAPVDGTSYTANTEFGSGSQIGTGNYVVYNGTGSSVAITGLSSSTTYYVAIAEFNGSGGSENYLTSSPLTGSQATSAGSGPADPSVTSTSSTTTTTYLGWTLNGSSDPVMLLFSTADDIGTPEDGTSYSVSETIGGGTVLYKGSGTEYTHEGRSQNTTYYYAIYSVDGSNNYSSGVKGPITTLKMEPSNHASSFTASNVTHNSMTLTWLDNDGTYVADKFLVVLESSSTFSPTDANGYPDDLSDTNDDNKWYANISHGTKTVTFSGLTSETTYYAKIWPISNTDKSTEKWDYKTDGTVPSANGTTGTLSAPTVNTVYISEVSDATGYQNEFIELYNNSNNYIDLSSCKIIRSGYIFDFSEGSGNTDIPPNGLIIIARGASKENFESEWGSLPSSVYYNTGHTNLYFGTGTAYTWSLKNGGTADTDDGTEIDNTVQAVGGTSKRHYQDPISVWTESTSSSATPGALEGNQDSSLPVELDGFNAIPGNGKVTLIWATESESENLGFIIQKRLLDAGCWTLVSDYTENPDLEGQGSTSEKHNYQYIDNAIQPGAIYEYRLGDVDFSGTVTWHSAVEVSVPENSATVPMEFGLHNAYPNPFNPSVTLSYTLADESQTTLSIYNMRGQLVESLVNACQPNGSYTITWQPRNLSTGVYIVRLESGNKTNLQKVVFVK